MVGGVSSKSLKMRTLCLLVFSLLISLMFNFNIFKCINDNIPRVPVKKSTSPPWIGADIIHLPNMKNTLWRKVKRFGTVFLKDKLRKLTNKLKILVEYKYYNYICDVSSDIYKNPKRFWSAF